MPAVITWSPNLHALVRNFKKFGIDNIENVSNKTQFTLSTPEANAIARLLTFKEEKLPREYWSG
ncbi:MAG: hypothetical protein JWM44_774 [Bacilli bacterium]|nr:hypothetical protein [Bacilli bacterium]